MGLAASQARLLALTAQLNDVEFEGQQINMARSTLSTQSAKFYNQLLNMEVPTPPVKTDYTSLVYRYNSNGTNYTITNIGAVDKDGNTTIITRHKGFDANVKTQDKDLEVKKIPVKGSKSVISNNKDDVYTGDGSHVVYKPASNAEYSECSELYNSNGESVGSVDDILSRFIQNTNNQNVQYLDGDGNPATAYSSPLYACNGPEYEVEYEYDETKPVYETEEDGTIKLDENNQPIIATDEDGNPIYELKEDENGDPIIKTDENGMPVTKKDDNGNPIVKGYQKGEPIDVEALLDIVFANTQYYVKDNEYTGTDALYQGFNTETEYTVDGQEVLDFSEIPDDTALDTDESDETFSKKALLEKAIRQTGRNVDDYYFIKDDTQECGYRLVEKLDVKDGEAAKQCNVVWSEDALLEEEQNVTLQFGTNGRVCRITLENGQEINVEPQTELDEFAYEDAFAQYTYEKALYDKEQAAINAQLSTIQQQDKRLELQLTELDTRRTEITTELDALKTVLGDAAERGFKTFSG